MRAPKEGARTSRQGAAGVSSVPSVEAVAVLSRAATTPAATVAKAATLVSSMGPRRVGGAARREVRWVCLGLRRLEGAPGTERGDWGCRGRDGWWGSRLSAGQQLGLCTARGTHRTTPLPDHFSLGVRHASESHRNCPRPVGELHPGVPLSAARKGCLGTAVAGGFRVSVEDPLKPYCWHTRCPPRRCVSVGSTPKLRSSQAPIHTASSARRLLQRRAPRARGKRTGRASSQPPRRLLEQYHKHRTEAWPLDTRL